MKKLEREKLRNSITFRARSAMKKREITTSRQIEERKIKNKIHDFKVIAIKRKKLKKEFYHRQREVKI